MNQNRYKKNEGLKDTFYIGKTYEYQTHTNGSKTHKYMIYANGKVVTVHTEATEVQLSGEKLTTYETRYLHYDSLGSVDAITNQQGTVVQRTAYKPFGEQIDLTKAKKSITNRGYTGHEHIEGTKFIHMNARLYDPTIGRFLSADTFIQDPYDSQSYNRYSYVRNNPLKYTDPTGHSWWTRHRILGTVSTVVGVLLIATNNPYAMAAGVAFLGLGQSLLNYDPNQQESQSNQISFSTSYSYNTFWGQTGGGLTTNQQSVISQGRALDERDRMRNASSSSNIDVTGAYTRNQSFQNSSVISAERTQSYAYTQASSSGNDGYVLEDISVTPERSLYSALVGDMTITYFTTLNGGFATPLGGVNGEYGVYMTVDPVFGVTEYGTLYSKGAAIGLNYGVGAMVGFVEGGASTLDGNFYTFSVGIGAYQVSTLYGDGEGNRKIHVGYGMGVDFNLGRFSSPIRAGSSLAWTNGLHTRRHWGLSTIWNRFGNQLEELDNRLGL